MKKKYGPGAAEEMGALYDFLRRKEALDGLKTESEAAAILYYAAKKLGLRYDYVRPRRSSARTPRDGSEKHCAFPVVHLRHYLEGSTTWPMKYMAPVFLSANTNKKGLSTTTSTPPILAHTTFITAPVAAAATTPFSSALM